MSSQSRAQKRRAGLKKRQQKAAKASHIDAGSAELSVEAQRIALNGRSNRAGDLRRVDHERPGQGAAQQTCPRRPEVTQGPLRHR